MLDMIKNAFGGLKEAGSLLKTFNRLKTEAEVAEKTLELSQIILSVQHDLFEAQAAYSAVVGRVSELEKELVAVKDWAAEKQRYQLYRLADGSFTYRLKPEMAEGEPVHDICPCCYQQGVKSILQFVGYDKKFHKFSCALCQTTVLGEKSKYEEAFSLPAPSFD